MSQKVSVHHFIANLTTRQYGPHPTSDLLGVDYIHDVPADTEFPRTLARVDLFTRFYLNGAKPTEFFVRVLWLDSPTPKLRRIGRYGPNLVSFQPNEAVHDHVFKVVNLRLAGAGRHRVLLLRKRTANWRGKRLAIIAQTHFTVER